jgi:L-aspartate oxidase
MTRYASVVRDGDGSERPREGNSIPRRHASPKSRSDFEDVALTTTAGAVAAAAQARTESHGCHHRSDYPDTDPAFAHSLVPAVAC